LIIEKVVIKNFKLFEDFTILFNHDINIIIGDNETGKTTILEAMYLALTLQLNGRYVQYELSPYLFNIKTVQKYVEDLQSNPKTQLPEILIEVYFYDDDSLAFLKGDNNSCRHNQPGIYLKIAFDNEYYEEYKAYISDPTEVRTIPIEYYAIHSYSFANNT
jgi:putative ATP-dependent endonuclease of OLD family